MSIEIHTNLEETEALALAQFAKRVTWTEMRGCAVDDTEAREIRSAIEKLRVGLADAGYAPR